MCSKYLEQASDKLNGFSTVAQASLPETLNLEDFAKFVASTCLSPSQVRMRLTQTCASSTGKALVKSQVSTVMLSFLTGAELLTTCQFVCRKWYYKFVAFALPKVGINGDDLVGRIFRIKQRGVQGSKPQYLA